MFNFDYDESQKNREFPLFAEGEAHFIIKNVHTQDKKGMPLVTKDGSNQMALDLIIEDCNHMTGNLRHYISSKMGFMIDQLGKAVGIDIYNPESVFDEKILIGKEGKCEIKHEEYKGEMHPKIKRYIESPDGVKPYDPFSSSTNF